LIMAASFSGEPHRASECAAYLTTVAFSSLSRASSALAT
jgi:hypothetical protein